MSIRPGRRGWWYSRGTRRLWIDGREFEVGDIEIDELIDNHAYFEHADRAEFAREVLDDLDDLPTADE
jgi:hypothetical protein